MLCILYIGTVSILCILCVGTVPWVYISKGGDYPMDPGMIIVLEIKIYRREGKSHREDDLPKDGDHPRDGCFPNDGTFPKKGLVMVRAVIWTQWFYLVFVSEIWDRQIDKQTNRKTDKQTD